MSFNEPTDRDRFCVLIADARGPAPSYWRDMVSVVGLLARHCNSKCGHGVSIWQRRSARGKWTLISSTT